jgi:hypothetical protein
MSDKCYAPGFRCRTCWEASVHSIKHIRSLQLASWPITVQRCKAILSVWIDKGSAEKHQSLPGRLRGDVIAVAVGALRRCRLVKHDVPSGHDPRQHVASGTRHVLMRALKRERRPAIVIKSCRLPAIDVVATGAIRDVPPACKLPRMNVIMAAGALDWHGAKVHMLECRFQIGRSVAIHARYCSMRAE